MTSRGKVTKAVRRGGRQAKPVVLFPVGRGLKQPFSNRVEHPGNINAAYSRYVDHPWLRDEAKVKWFLDYQIEWPDTSWYLRLDADGNGPRKIYQAWTLEEERVAFLRFNYFRMRAIDAVRHKKPRRDIRRWESKAFDIRTMIAAQNLGLVLKMFANLIEKTGGKDDEFVSEGNMALLRAIDLFDVGRGFKFSTYACRAIIKAHTRERSKNAKFRSHEVLSYGGEDTKHLEPTYVHSTRESDEEAFKLELLQKVMAVNGAELTPVECQVIDARFNLSSRGDAKVTLDDIGKLVGLTKERVRQIQNQALSKLKVAVMKIYGTP